MYLHYKQTTSLMNECLSFATAARPRRRSIPARTDLVQEGKQVESVYILIEGWTTPYRMFEDGRRQVMAVLVPGDCCHFDVLSDNAPRHSVCAITPCVVDVYPRSVIREQIDRHPKLNQAFWNETLASVAVQQEWMTMLGRRSAVERLGHLFCEIYYRIDRIGGVVDGGCYFPLTQVDLADAVALTPVHLNRTLQVLRAAGLVALSHRRLTIPNAARLAEMSLFDAHYLQHEQARLGTSPALADCW